MDAHREEVMSETPSLSLRLRTAAVHDGAALLRICCVFIARLLRDLLRACCASIYTGLDIRERIHG